MQTSKLSRGIHNLAFVTVLGSEVLIKFGCGSRGQGTSTTMNDQGSEIWQTRLQFKDFPVNSCRDRRRKDMLFTGRMAGFEKESVAKMLWGTNHRERRAAETLAQDDTSDRNQACGEELQYLNCHQALRYSHSTLTGA